MTSILDALLANQTDTVSPFRPAGNAFPRNAAGQLIDPAAVQTEGARINASLDAGTYGSQPQRIAPAGGGGVTIVPASSTVNPSDSFFFEPSMMEQNRNRYDIRQDLKLDELRTTAALRKAELERQPIRDAFAEAQLAHEQAATAALGATNARQVRNDATAMQHIAGFENYMVAAPQPGTKEYDNYVRKGLAKFPAILTTKYGANHIPKLGQEHDIAALAAQLPEGFEITSVTAGGGKQSHVTAKRIGATEERDLKTDYGITPEQIKHPTGVVVGTPDPDNPTKFKQSNTGTHVAITTGKGTTVVMPTSTYEKFGGIYSGETAKARAAAGAPTLTKPPVQVTSIDQANALPSGTTFLTPEGKLKVKP